MQSLFDMIQSLGWPMTVITFLLILSETLPMFPNIEANSTVQLIRNILKDLKAKLSLEEPKV